MAHMQPLPVETTPGLRDDFGIFEKILGFVPNSLLTMQRRPKMVRGFGELTKGVMDPEGPVDLGLMRCIPKPSAQHWILPWRRVRYPTRSTLNCLRVCGSTGRTNRSCRYLAPCASMGF